METFIAIAAILLGLIGILGSILPGLPGPPLSWVGILLLHLWGGGADRLGNPLSAKLMWVLLVVTIVVQLLDYFVPGFFTKTTGGSKYGSRGAILGLFFGMFHYSLLLVIDSSDCGHDEGWVSVAPDILRPV